MPSFPHTLIGLGPFADVGYNIVFTKTSVPVYHPDGHSILSGWRDETGPRLWHFPLTVEAAQVALDDASPQPPIPSPPQPAPVDLVLTPRRFPVRARSGNQYVMIAFHADGNLILQQAFKCKSDRHRIAAYNAIMTRLAARGLFVDLQILDNKVSSAYKEAITFKWNATFQLVPPDMHCRNWAERAICTFMDHILTILSGVNAAFPPFLWDLLLPQAELTLNLLRQAMLNP
jgi:hypothetical protein